MPRILKLILLEWDFIWIPILTLGSPGAQAADLLEPADKTTLFRSFTCKRCSI